MTASFDTVGPGRFRVTGPMTFETVGELLRVSEERLVGTGRVEIDLAQVGESDSAGLALLIEWKRIARQRGAALEFKNLPPQLTALAHISEVDELLTEAPTPPPVAEAGNASVAV